MSDMPGDVSAFMEQMSEETSYDEMIDKLISVGESHPNMGYERLLVSAFSQKGGSKPALLAMARRRQEEPGISRLLETISE